MEQPKFAPWHFVGQGILMDEEEENEIVLADIYDEPAAKLIEAAPNLYAALREAREWILGEGSIVPDRLVERMTAALEKADAL